MKCSKSFIITVVAVLIVGRFLWHRWSEMANKPAMTTGDGASIYLRKEIMKHQRAETNSPAAAPSSRQAPHGLGFREKANEMTDAEKVEMTNLFVTKLKPAAEKWASVYTNRVPFDLEDLTPDKVVGRLGWGDSRYDAYMFVMGDITFGVQVFHGDTYVNYLASRQGVGAMNALPKLAGPADLSMPVTREQVLDLVEADSGKQFPLNEVVLRPTGQSGSLMGGANVKVGKDASNPEMARVTTKETSFSLTFGPDGKLVYYERDP